MSRDRGREPIRGPAPTADGDANLALLPGAAPRSYWLAAAALALVASTGWAALVVLALGGAEPRAKWGYAAATLAFLLSTVQAVPVISWAARLGRGAWATPLHRVGELSGTAGLVTAPLLVVLQCQLPEWPGRPSIWFDWPGAPLVWDALAAGLLAACGVAQFFASSLPDLRAAADREPAAPEAARAVWRRLALGWRGTTRQWAMLQRGLVALGAIYCLLFVFVHLLVASDLGLSLMPGWGSSIVPAYHAVSALGGGTATALLALALVRRRQHLERFVPGETFRTGAKLLLALSLLWLYFAWAEYFPQWYAPVPAEHRILALFVSGPSRWVFAAAAALTGVLPFLLLMWPPVRATVVGPAAAAALVVGGLLVDRVRLFVPSWALAGPVAERVRPLEHLVGIRPPGVADVLVMAGMPASVGVLWLLARRLVPAVSLWEYKHHTRGRPERRDLQAVVPVLATPE